MGGIIIHQWDEQAGGINQSEDRKEKKINAFGKNAGLQTMEFAGKVKLFLLQRSQQLRHLIFYKISYKPEIGFIHFFGVGDFPINKFF